MDKRKQIIELIKEDSWHNIPVENTVDKIFSILSVVGQTEQLICGTCKSGLIDYPDINRRTCRCGRLGYNVID